MVQRSYTPLGYSDIPSLSRSFHLEYLHRSLISQTKQEAMNRGINLYCNHCNELASSTHVLNDCILAQLCQKIFIKFFESRNMKQRLLQTEVFYEYFWWDTKVFEHQFFKEMWLVWIET